jgi:hypothetical protein
VRNTVKRIAFLGAFAAYPVQAGQFVAPLPDGYQTTGAKSVSGLYAEITGLTSIYDDQAIEEFDAACQAEGKKVVWQDRENGSKGAVRIYRTAAAAAVIRKSVRLVTDRKTCVARYIVEVEATVKTSPWAYTDLGYFEDPDLKCLGRRTGRRCHEEVIAGVRVTCLDRGDGFVGDVICVSRENDLTRGLLVSYSSYVDDGSMPTGGWHLSLIEPNALIDPAVFRAGPKN